MSTEIPIFIDWSKVDWSAQTTQTDFENLVHTIRWFWPYVHSDEQKSWEKTIWNGLNGPSFKSELGLIHIIPIECRIPTDKEIEDFYPGLKGWNFTNIKMIFYEETFSSGVRKINYCTPYRFFSEFKPEEEK